MFLACTHTYTQNSKLKEQKESFGGDGYVYYLYCGDGFTGVRIRPDSPSCVYQICAIFLHISYTCNVLVKKKKKEPENTLKFDHSYMFYEGKVVKYET